ncbi:MAG: pyrimidine/purine nucleoside phosphorylase [Betaproteobacteria bacterium]
MAQFDKVSVIKKANIYFDGKCISHTVVFPDDTRKTLGVILPSSLTFNTGAPEVMEGVGGSCRVRLKGESEWKTYGEGQSFKVPGNSSFEIEVAEGGAYHYVCHFG